MILRNGSLLKNKYKKRGRMRQGMMVDGKIAYAWRSRERGDFSDYHLHVSEACDGT
jgi:hypothetical protein